MTLYFSIHYLNIFKTDMYLNVLSEISIDYEIKIFEQFIFDFNK